MSASPLQVYEAIKPKLGEKEAQLLLEHVARQTEVSTKDLATKADVRDMATKADLAREIGMLRAELHDEIGKLRSELHDEIGKLRADMIKWMFLFWVGQQAVLLGILFAFFK